MSWWLLKIKTSLCLFQEIVVISMCVHINISHSKITDRGQAWWSHP
jgi:hypothetical protein